MATPIEGRPPAPDIDEQKRLMDERNLAYQRPGGGLFGIEDEPQPIVDRREDMVDEPQPIMDSREDMGMPPATTQYTGGTTDPDAGLLQVNPRDNSGLLMSDPLWAFGKGPRPADYQERLDTRGLLPVEPSVEQWKDNRPAGFGPEGRNTSTQMVAGVPTSMANFRPRLPGQAQGRRRGLGLDRRAALLRALGIG